MSAEIVYARAWHHHSIDDLITAKRIYPFLSYVKNGPWIALYDKNFMLVMRGEPQALEKLAAALFKL